MSSKVELKYIVHFYAKGQTSCRVQFPDTGSIWLWINSYGRCYKSNLRDSQNQEPPMIFSCFFEDAELASFDTFLKAFSKKVMLDIFEKSGAGLYRQLLRICKEKTESDSSISLKDAQESVNAIVQNVYVQLRGGHPEAEHQKAFIETYKDCDFAGAF